ncbi:MAG: hypothetical protein JSU68_12110 [Phycisphaerales bacterium]|nr:MAG: hypothetical protein JSU68_12110 [Phycisphaerales bacterium]
MAKRWILTTAIGMAAIAPVWGQTAQTSGQSSAADLGRSIRERQSLRGLGQPSQIQKWLNQNVESVSFDEELFEDVIRWLRERPGEVNIVVEWNVMEGLGVDREMPITLELKNVPLSKVLQLVLKQAGVDVPLGYRGEENILTITLEEELNAPRNFVIRTYQVTDLVRTFINFDNPPSIRLSNLQQTTSGGGAASSNLFADDDDDEQDEELEERVQAIIDMLVETIEPETWSQNGGQGTATAVRDVIIINNSIAVHEKIGGAVRLRPGR